MTLRTVVIAGGGLTGASAAAALRKREFDGAIVVVGSEAHLPYELPKLSKEYLRGEYEASALLAKPEGFYAEHAIDMRTSTTATEIRPREQTVLLNDGSVQPYDRLLIATGADARPLDAPGGDLPGVYRLRTYEDADAIRTAAATAEHIVVIGGGWIGAEVAASLRQLGRTVALVAPSSTLLERDLGPEVGAVYRDLHARNGVELSMNTRVRELRGRGSGRGGRHDGRLVAAGGPRRGRCRCVPSRGAGPRTGIAIGDGIEVDETLETSVPGIFAAGDVASAWHPVFGRRMRVEHWDNARKQGAAAAAAMLGVARTVRPRAVPVFRPVRPLDGVQRVRARMGSRRVPRRSALRQLQRVLACGRSAPGRHAGEHRQPLQADVRAGRRSAHRQPRAPRGPVDPARGHPDPHKRRADRTGPCRRVQPNGPRRRSRIVTLARLETAERRHHEPHGSDTGPLGPTLVHGNPGATGGRRPLDAAERARYRGGARRAPGAAWDGRRDVEHDRHAPPDARRAGRGDRRLRGRPEAHHGVSDRVPRRQQLRDRPDRRGPDPVPRPLRAPCAAVRRSGVAGLRRARADPRHQQADPPGPSAHAPVRRPGADDAPARRRAGRR